MFSKSKGWGLSNLTTSSEPADLGLSMITPDSRRLHPLRGLAQAPSPLPRLMGSLVPPALLCLLPPL